MKRRLMTLLMAATLFGGSMGGAAMAFHSSPPQVSPHQHVVNGQQVGPNACDNGMSIQFDHFHNNVHAGQPGFGGLGKVTSLPCPST